MAKYRGIDLFAGIGGIRLGFQQVFGDDLEFVYSNDFDKYASITYEANFGESLDTRDIIEVVEDMDNIPDHDILLGGFPCQPFSMAGARLGFEDETRGTLFYSIAKILEQKKPAMFLLENVKHFERHAKGRTWNTIRRVLTQELGYSVFAQTLDARNFGLPQKRVRFYMVGFKNRSLSFSFPKGNVPTPSLRDFLEDEVEEKYYLSQKYLVGLKRHRARHEAKGHGFGYVVLDRDVDIANTIVVGGMGRERNLVQDRILEDCWKPGDDLKRRNCEGVRKMTPREWSYLQGFPSDFKIPVSMTRAYKQFGNSVPVPVIKAVAENMKKSINGHIFSDKLDKYLG